MPAWTTEEFISKAREKHGDKYDYDRAEYSGSREKVTVTCKTHGDFEVAGVHHISGSGCPKCAQSRSKSNQAYTTEIFIEKARDKHGDQYDYSKVNYKHSKEDVLIICPNHGEFSMPANRHLKGSGCPPCGLIKMVESKKGKQQRKPIDSTEDFIEMAKEVHGDRYDYSESLYLGANIRVDVICPHHGYFTVIARAHIDPKRLCACPQCGIRRSATSRSKGVDEFIKEAKEVHGNRYDYDKVVYTNCDSVVIISCEDHGDFEQTPYHHIKHQSGCPSCGNNYRYTTDSFIAKAQLVHGQTFAYSNTEYEKAHGKIVITCSRHGDFEQVAYRHLQGHGCIKCWLADGVSQRAIDWLNYQSFLLGRPIQHARNGGEYEIPDTRFRADGYDLKTNTVYEFYGKLFHCDPRVFPKDEWNPFFKCQNRVIYEKTTRRADMIRSKGFRITEMWEVDWLELIKKVRLIQRAWRDMRHKHKV